MCATEDKQRWGVVKAQSSGTCTWRVTWLVYPTCDLIWLPPQEFLWLHLHFPSHVQLTSSSRTVQCELSDGWREINFTGGKTCLPIWHTCPIQIIATNGRTWLAQLICVRAEGQDCTATKRCEHAVAGPWRSRAGPGRLRGVVWIHMLLLVRYGPVQVRSHPVNVLL